MSRFIDLFIESALALDDLASELTRLTGTPCLAAPDAPMWVLTDGDVVAELSEHRFVDDRNLKLSRYRYCLSARVGPDAAVDHNSPQTLSLRAVQATLRAARYSTLLVWDLQNRLDQQPGPGDGPDELSLPPDDLDPSGSAAVEEPVS
jgi:hypothetical protein